MTKDKDTEPSVKVSGITSFPIKNNLDLIRELSEVSDWISLCSFLGVSRGILDDLEHSGETVTLKRRKCLNNYYDSGEADWAKVVSVVANPPISKKKRACEIAKKYMEGIDMQTCLAKYKIY